MPYFHDISPPPLPLRFDADDAPAFASAAEMSCQLIIDYALMMLAFIFEIAAPVRAQDYSLSPIIITDHFIDFHRRQIYVILTFDVDISHY